MKIRNLRADDLEELSALASVTFAEAFGHGFSKEELQEQLRETRSVSYFRSVIEADTILVAEIDAVLVGYIQICDMRIVSNDIVTQPEDQAINALYVARDYQGQGLGRKLMAAAFAHERLKAAPNIYIDVWGENHRALNFYLSYGFVQAGYCDVIVDGEVIGQDLVLKFEGSVAS